MAITLIDSGSVSLGLALALGLDGNQRHLGRPLWGQKRKSMPSSGRIVDLSDKPKGGSQRAASANSYRAPFFAQFHTSMASWKSDALAAREQR